MGEKKVLVRKRHYWVDTMGNLQAVVVTAADVEDSEGAKIVLGERPELAAKLQKLWADQKYRGPVQDWVREEYGIKLEVVKREPDQVGFVPLPKRWIVERSIAWMMRWRRLSKDYEGATMYSEAWIYIGAIGLSLQRITPSGWMEKPYIRKVA